MTSWRFETFSLYQQEDTATQSAATNRSTGDAGLCSCLGFTGEGLSYVTAAQLCLLASAPALTAGMRSGQFVEVMTTSLARRAEQAVALAEAATQRGASAEASTMQQASLPFELTATAYRRYSPELFVCIRCIAVVVKRADKTLARSARRRPKPARRSRRRSRLSSPAPRDTAQPLDCCGYLCYLL